VTSAARLASTTYVGELGSRQPDESGGKDRRGGRVGTHDQVARRTDHCEDRDREQNRVQPCSERRARDRRIAQYPLGWPRRQGSRLPQRPVGLVSNRWAERPGATGGVCHWADRLPCAPSVPPGIHHIPYGRPTVPCPMASSRHARSRTDGHR
jgi:hypothetical protein